MKFFFFWVGEGPGGGRGGARVSDFVTEIQNLKTKFFFPGGEGGWSK